MDFDAAMAAHTDWKVNLRVALETKAVVDADRARSDCNCALGKWLHGEARARWGADESYRQCVAAHREFHDAAGEVASTINSRAFDQAGRMLESGARFSAASMKVAVAVRRLRAIVQA